MSNENHIHVIKNNQEYNDGVYFSDECEQLWGPYPTKREARLALEKYIFALECPATNIYIVFGYNKQRKYLTQGVAFKEKLAKKMISRLEKLDKKYSTSIEGYFYETWEVDKMPKRILEFLERKQQ